MLIYFEEANQAVNTDDISRIYQYAIPKHDINEDIARQLEDGVNPNDLVVPDPEYASTIILRDGTSLNVNIEVKDIIKEIKNG